MLPRELVQKLIGWDSSTRLNVLKTPSNAFDCFLIVLPFPVEIIREGVVERISGTLPAPAGVLL